MSKYFSNKEKLIEIFKDTMEITKEYQKETASCIKDSVIYIPEKVTFDTPDNTYDAKLRVSTNTTIDEALDTYQSNIINNDNGKIAILNFASAKHPGGMVKTGSSAQEECICRCTNLYPVLSDPKFKKDYYEYHKSRHDPLYSSRIIYTPNIIVFKNDANGRYNMIDNPISVDVITCAAPNLRDFYGNVDRNLKVRAESLDVMYHRIQFIFSVALANNVEHLILGAFGCGVFKNDPYYVAEQFKRNIDEFGSYFKSIRFPIYCNPNYKERINYDAFTSIVTEEK